MKSKKILKDEKGATAPIVALILSIVLLGFTALVIDTGIAYAERRNMVTAADAAALAGAGIMEEAFSSGGDVEAAKIEAEEYAKDIAMLNGVEERSDINIIWDNSDYDRDTITVTVRNNINLFFARFLGFNDMDITAKAVATWGYVTKLEGGEILPIFTKDSDYQPDDLTYLHTDKLITDADDYLGGNWGILDIYGSTSGIADAFRKSNVEASLEINVFLDNQTGLNVGNVNSPIEDRMITANTLDLIEERQQYMYGLVPIIDWNNVMIQGSSLKLPITTFAVFEIYDVIVAEGNGGNKYSKGSIYALYDSDYECDNIAATYPRMDINGDGEVEDMAKSTIIGKFTGEKVEVRAIVEPGDQTNPAPGILTATYSKLIE